MELFGSVNGQENVFHATQVIECMGDTMTWNDIMDRYTLGGFYLARYEDSPVGAFDEVGGIHYCT